MFYYIRDHKVYDHTNSVVAQSASYWTFDTTPGQLGYTNAIRLRGRLDFKRFMAELGYTELEPIQFAEWIDGSCAGRIRFGESCRILVTKGGRAELRKNSTRIWSQSYESQTIACQEVDKLFGAWCTLEKTKKPIATRRGLNWWAKNGIGLAWAAQDWIHFAEDVKNAPKAMKIQPTETYNDIIKWVGEELEAAGYEVVEKCT